MTARRKPVTGFMSRLGNALRPSRTTVHTFGPSDPQREDRVDREALDRFTDAQERGELETIDHAEMKRRLGLG